MIDEESNQTSPATTKYNLMSSRFEGANIRHIAVEHKTADVDTISLKRGKSNDVQISPDDSENIPPEFKVILEIKEHHKSPRITSQGFGNKLLEPPKMKRFQKRHSHLAKHEKQ